MRFLGLSHSPIQFFVRAISFLISFSEALNSFASSTSGLFILQFKTRFGDFLAVLASYNLFWNGIGDRNSFLKFCVPFSFTLCTAMGVLVKLSDEPKGFPPPTSDSIIFLFRTFKVLMVLGTDSDLTLLAMFGTLICISLLGAFGSVEDLLYTLSGVDNEGALSKAF